MQKGINYAKRYKGYNCETVMPLKLMVTRNYLLLLFSLNTFDFSVLAMIKPNSITCNDVYLYIDSKSTLLISLILFNLVGLS